MIEEKFFTIDLGFDWCSDKKYLESSIISRHNIFEYTYQRINFDIIDPKAQIILRPLFDIFFNISKEHFDLKYDTPNYKFWSYVSNKDRNVCMLHDHKNTATANGVFYLKVPECKDKEEGGLLLQKDYSDSCKKNVFYDLEGCLVIFSGNLPHKPLPIYTEDYRISINMEAI